MFCSANHINFPLESLPFLVDFLCLLADSSDRPKAVLNNALQAIKHLYAVLGLPSPVADGLLPRLIVALIKSGTKAPATETPLMPIKPFHDLFLKWDHNNKLTLKDLSLKSIFLVAMYMMLRPSDVSPNAQILDPEEMTIKNVEFKRSQICFYDDNSMKVTLFRIKNDTYRHGFPTDVKPATEPKPDPVQAIKDYIDCTSHLVDGTEGPIFLALTHPYNGISASTIAKVLTEAIHLAGLSSNGYTAKCFRPTEATCAVKNNVDPEVVMNVGHWKT